MKKLLQLSWGISALICLFFWFGSKSAHSQDQVVTFLKAGLDDANKLSDAYISPFGKAFGASLNNGWFNTAKTHKIGGFDLTFGLNAVMVPKKFRTYDINDLDLKTTKLTNSSNDPVAPTLFGDNKNGSEVSVMFKNPITNQDSSITKFKLPPGVGYSLLPLPYLQLRIGLPKNTDLMFRYAPELSIPGNNFSGKLKYYGFGFMHDVKQWIPVISELPFSLAVQAAYAKFNFTLDFPNALLPDTAGQTYHPDGTLYTLPSNLYADQGFEYDVSAFNLNAIISKKLPVITFYGALGMNYSKSEISLFGSYPISVSVGNPITYPNVPLGKRVTNEFKDPLKISSTYVSPRITGGFRLKMAFFTLHADYTYSNFPVVTAGIGLTIRD